MSCVWESIETGIGPGAAFWRGGALAALTVGGDPDEVGARLARACGEPFARESHPSTPLLVRQLGEYLAGERAAFDIPLHIIGGGMQRAVWEALAGISYGERISYGELAGRVGCRSVRAVGTAVGKNPLPLLLPCHRVVRADGKIGNYSCADGPETKRRLLEMERVRAAQLS